jgi:hypothetical protein
MLNGYYVQNKERVVELMDADEYYPDLEEESCENQ